MENKEENVCTACGCSLDEYPNHDVGECCANAMGCGMEPGGLEEQEITPYGVRDEYGGL